VIARPDGPLTDGVVTLRLPCRDDAVAVKRWASAEMLEGIWISGHGPVAISDATEWARGVVDGLMAGWTDEGSIHGPCFVIDEAEPFVGVAYLNERGPGTVELTYGVAPPFRRRGIATRAARVASDWLLRDGRYERVELWIAEGHPERSIIAERAGFRFMRRVETLGPDTDQTFVDVVFVRP
jgi:RimJ/RimL family protein N-acetyltransferase